MGIGRKMFDSLHQYVLYGWLIGHNNVIGMFFCLVRGGVTYAKGSCLFQTIQGRETLHPTGAKKKDSLKMAFKSFGRQMCFVDHNFFILNVIFFKDSWQFLPPLIP